MSEVDPVDATVAFCALALVTALVGVWLRRRLGRATSLGGALGLLLGAAGLVAVAAGGVGASVMLFDGQELAGYLAMVTIVGAFVGALVLVVSRPLVRDVHRLGVVAGEVEEGDLGVRTGIVRSDELGQAAVAIDQMLDRLDRLERQRRADEAERHRLVTSISHDLRTPVAALRAATEALADGLADDPDRYLASMQRDLIDLGHLIDDLFLVARLEGERVELERQSLDLVELVEAVAEGLRPLAAERSVLIELAGESSAPVTGDERALGRVVRNLLDNALRHAPDGSRVVIETRRRSGEIELAVLDEGSGFPEGFRERAFDRFTRADESRNRASGGSGLGLAIARGLVEAHGGRIHLGEGPGGQVVVSLPRG